MRRDLPRESAARVNGMAKAMEVIGRDVAAVAEGIMSREPDEASRAWVDGNIAAAELLEARLEATLEVLGQASVYLAEGGSLPGGAEDTPSTGSQFAVPSTNT